MAADSVHITISDKYGDELTVEAFAGDNEAIWLETDDKDGFEFSFDQAYKLIDALHKAIIMAGG